MNSVSFTGNLVADPEEVETDSDITMARLRIAVPRYRNGERDGIFIDVTAFDRQATLALEHLSKGRLVGISGRLDMSEWQDTEGKNRSRIYVVAGMMDFLDAPPEKQVDNERARETPQRRKRTRRPEPAVA